MQDHDILLAKQLCRRLHTGVLATHSQKIEGYPLGSIVPYFLTPEGEPIIYISSIAQHTNNIKRDNKVSLTLFDNQESDSQASGRVCILGNAEICEDEALAEQYYQFFPDARAYKNTHDFAFYKVRVVKIRYIGGFGKIHWISQEAWLSAHEDWVAKPDDMISHMNEDHKEAMQLILQNTHNIYANDVTMISAFREGCHFSAADRVYFIPYETNCETAMDVRKALVKLTNDARKEIS